MKKIILSLGVLSLLVTSYTFADEKPKEESVSLITVANNLDSAGYKNIYEIERKGKKYDVIVVNPNSGDKTKLVIDAKTGRVPKPIKINNIGVLKALAIAQENGCKNITKAENGRKAVEIKCTDKDRNKHTLIIDVQTGKVIKNRGKKEKSEK
ncbi:PepSY domain-containing protein [Pseudofrancisella aestuarii]|uniref:PepSY domain-containing protein n=1 Tax=Pseudofrancisella aestuarii TaxID=2670347 RepID=A0ABV9TAD7_9GAMM|nr:PepSY domain-containing protein [Pseudofrancisella aestuarii]